MIADFMEPSKIRNKKIHPFNAFLSDTKYEWYYVYFPCSTDKRFYRMCHIPNAGSEWSKHGMTVYKFRILEDADCDGCHKNIPYTNNSVVYTHRTCNRSNIEFPLQVRYDVSRSLRLSMVL